MINILAYKLGKASEVYVISLVHNVQFFLESNTLVPTLNYSYAQLDKF